jgi:plasmid stabilization system protein ParE
MPETTIHFHPDALKEVEIAQAWYSDRSIIAAYAFVSELTHAISQVKQAPGMWPKFTNDTRRYVFPRFPFYLVYRMQPDNLIEVIAVMHQKKKPGYWDSRL